MKQFNQMKYVCVLLLMLTAWMPSAHADTDAVAVDLGLPSGTKWANMNVGATKPEDYGSYFAWGETEEKEMYNWSTYIHCDGSRETCHDIGTDIAGTQYDVAHVQWGGSWKMPNRDQVRELSNNCTSEWTTVNGINCIKLTGPNGNSIFLPATGALYNDGPSYVGESGYYWSSSYDEHEQDIATHLYLYSGGVFKGSGEGRCVGMTIRPVVTSSGEETTDIVIDATNFPDENFRNWLLEQDYGQDRVLTQEEIQSVTVINVDEKGISDFKGIEFFTALKKLNCPSNQLTSIDISKNTALERLICYNNQLTSIDVSNNTALTYLGCYSNQLTFLDMSNNTALTDLVCSSNQMTSIDVSNNTALKYFDCSFNQLTSIDVSKNTALKVLNCNSNQLTTLIVSKNVALVNLFCDSNQLTSLDVSKNIALEIMTCNRNQLTALDVTNNVALEILDCSCNQINGTGMEILISSLPSIDSSQLYAIDNSRAEGNVCTPAQVSIANSKGWKVYTNDGSGWVEMEGEDNPVIPEGALITSVSQLSSPYTEPTESSLAEMIDNNPDTFWHSVWSSGSVECGLHYFQIEMPDMSDIDYIKFQYTRRDIVNDQTVLWGVYGTNDFGASKEACTKLGEFSTPFSSTTETLTSQPFRHRGFKYLRFYSEMQEGVEYSARGYFHVAEFQLYPAEGGEEFERQLMATRNIDGVTYSVYKQILSKEDCHVNADGASYYLTEVSLDISRSGVTNTYVIDSNLYMDEHPTSMVPCMMFDIEAQTMYMFCLSKNENVNYGLEGYYYVSSMNDVSFVRENVFFDRNWGWWASFEGFSDGCPQLFHFSYAGYYKMTSTRVSDGTWETEYGESIEPDDYAAYRSGRDLMLIVNDGGQDLDLALYEAALEAIAPNAQFRIFTQSNGTTEGTKKYYLTENGYLTESEAEAHLFTFGRAEGSYLFVSPGWKLDIPFTNPVLSDGATGDLPLHGHIRTDYYNGIRDNWEGQVWYKRGDRYAVRSTNSVSDEWGANTYWTVLDSDANGLPEADYSLTPNFVWQLEELEIEPLDEDETVTFDDEESGIDEDADLAGNVIGDIFYNITAGNGSYDAAEGCITVTKPTSDEQMQTLEGQDIFGEDFKSQFTGIVFKVPAGSGTVKVTAETTGNTTLKVKIGNNAPIEMELEGKLKASFPYNVSEPTYVYIYAGQAPAGVKAQFDAVTDTEGSLKIYGIELQANEDGIETTNNKQLTIDNASIYNLSGQRLSKPQRGANIIDGKKVVIK